MDLCYSYGVPFHNETAQQEILHSEGQQAEKELIIGSSVIRLQRAPLRASSGTLSEVLRELRSKTGDRGWRERELLIEVLSGEDKLQTINTTEINNLMKKARVSEENWRTIKTAKRKIRKKLNKRVSDKRKKNKLQESKDDVEVCQAEKERLLAEVEYLERECELYLIGIDRLSKEGH